MFTILAFDERPERLETLIALLARRSPECRVVRATSWDDCMAKFADGGFGIVLWLIRGVSPVGRDLEAFGALRRAVRVAPMSVVVVEGAVVPETRARWMAAGAAVVAGGPMDDEELAGWIELVTGSPGELPRRRTEDALRAVEERLREMFDHMTSGVAVYRPVGDGEDFEFLDYNAAAERATGVGRGELLGRRVTEVFPGVRELGLFEVLARVHRTGRPEHHPSREYRNGRLAFWVENYVYRLGTGEVVAIFDDVTERRQADEQIRLHSHILANSQEEIFLFDAATLRFTYANRCALENLQLSVDRLLELTPVDIKPELDRASFEAILAPLRAGTLRLQVFETTHRRADGSTYPVEVHLQLFEEQRLFLAVIMDISARRQAEKERDHLVAQLLQAQKLESVGRLAGGVAHDFNNMLGVIQGHAELALEHLDPALPLAACLREILEVAGRSADLTRQLLTFARRQAVTPRPMDLNETVAGLIRMLRRLLGEDVALDWRPCEQRAGVLMDPAQVDQVLVNLCVNSRDAITGSGRIAIETAVETLDAVTARQAGVAPGGWVRLIVSDDGCGMDEETRLHAFEPFFTTKGAGRGTGLGLATVYGIVQQNGGRIRLEPAPVRGTRCVILLPLRESEGEEAGPPVDVASGGAGESILLVEDEPANLRVTRMMLERLGYQVTGVGTPEEALALGARMSAPFDLLMTDVVMPGMNGRELARALLQRHPGLRCLFMSGYTADIIAHHGILEDGVDFLQKPFSKTTLAARLRSVLDR